MSPSAVEKMLEPADVFPPDDDVSDDHTGLLSGHPSYGLGLMLNSTRSFGLVAGHNGGGPGYQASAFRSSASGVSVCAMSTIEDDFRAEAVVADVFECIQVRA